MAEGINSSLILHGVWSSPYVTRVELALKVKRISFEYVEENLENKSDELLKLNPVFKKVPLLVHNGQPVIESLVILEYIDETWTNSPKLLPEHPYQRAKARFWTGFIHQLLESFGKLINTIGTETFETTLQDVFAKLSIMEDGMKTDYFPKGNPEINGADDMGILDVLIIPTLGNIRSLEEVSGVKILVPEKHPLVFQWVTALMNLPLVKETTPSHEKMVSLLRMLKEHSIKI